MKKLPTSLVLVAWLFVITGNTAVADTITFPPGPLGIPGFDPFPLQLPTGGQSDISAGETDTWTLSLANNGTVPWCDFHITLFTDTPPIILGQDGLQFLSASATNFGQAASRSFVLGDQLTAATVFADLPCDPDLLVQPGQNFQLIFVVRNNSNLLQHYRPRIQATPVPEPSTLTLLGTGTLTLLGCGWRRRRRAA